MAHDFAKTRHKNRAEAAPPPPPQPNKGMLLTGVFTGLVLGFFASFLIYLSGVLPPVTNSDPQAEADSAAEVLAAQQRRNDELEQAAERLQLEFYKELPNYEVIVDNMPNAAAAVAVPATASTTPSAAPSSAQAPVSTAQEQGSYMIQAGAFQQESSAQAQSARLTALGLEARIKKEALLGKTLFLVQAGPYNTREQVTQAERLLRSASIDSIRIGLSQ